MHWKFAKSNEHYKPNIHFSIEESIFKVPVIVTRLFKYILCQYLRNSYMKYIKAMTMNVAKLFVYFTLNDISGVTLRVGKVVITT